MTVFDLFRLEGRRALVTGGSKGLGEAIARGLAEAGAEVALTARSADTLQKAGEQLAGHSAQRVVWTTSDLSQEGEPERLARWATDQLGGIDILVNNAGSNEPQELVETTDESWERIVRLNLTSCMQLARALAPGMIERGWGRIVHLSSVMAVASNPGRGSYSATKGALVSMSRAHALELGPHGVTVNCIGPGPIMTDLPMSLLSDEQKRSFAERTAVKRWGDPQDVVGPALLLCSEAGRNITGTLLLVEGGMVCRTF